MFFTPSSEMLYGCSHLRPESTSCLWLAGLHTDCSIKFQIQQGYVPGATVHWYVFIGIMKKKTIHPCCHEEPCRPQRGIRRSTKTLFPTMIMRWSTFLHEQFGHQEVWNISTLLTPTICSKAHSETSISVKCKFGPSRSWLPRGWQAFQGGPTLAITLVQEVQSFTFGQDYQGHAKRLVSTSAKSKGEHFDVNWQKLSKMQPSLCIYFESNGVKRVYLLSKIQLL